MDVPPALIRGVEAELQRLRRENDELRDLAQQAESDRELYQRMYERVVVERDALRMAGEIHPRLLALVSLMNEMKAAAADEQEPQPSQP